MFYSMSLPSQRLALRATHTCKKHTVNVKACIAYKHKLIHTCTLTHAYIAQTLRAGILTPHVNFVLQIQSLKPHTKIGQ